MLRFLPSATKDMSFHLACIPSKTFSLRLGFSWRCLGMWLGTWCLMVVCMFGSPGQADEPSELWSLKPLQEDLLGGIDPWLDRGFQQMGLPPNPLADRYTWIRRATFDLTGLPPSPEEIIDFVEDSSDHAYARLIDRLLASPRYGERWGRHWLDLVRYADTNGADENMAFPNAWRYRDYVIESFNRDKPYDVFLKEQIAGDLLSKSNDVATQADRLTALGMLAIGPKMLAEQDKEKLLFDVVDEQIDVVTRTFMGLSVACARCHDHKFDPITQEDYYALAGIFKSTQTMAHTDHVSRWVERVLPDPSNQQRQAAFDKEIAMLEKQLSEAQNEKGDSTVEGSGEASEAVQKALDALKQKGPGLPQVMSVREGKPENIPILHRGNHLLPGDETVQRGRISLLEKQLPVPEVAKNQSGRLELASWLADSRHPLVARVMVNRVWTWHFGKGLVDTPSDFGQHGGKPSHPMLLDGLARRFIQSGFSLKSLHREIMMSQAYRRTSRTHDEWQVRDPENRMLWRRQPLRLEAEPLRDAILHASGLLNLSRGDALGALKKNNQYFSELPGAFDAPYRAVYLPILRSRVYELFATFDFPDASAHLESRSRTLMPQQALFFMNDPLVSRAVSAMVGRSFLSGGCCVDDRLNHVYLTLLARLPTAEESALFDEYLLECQVAENGEIPDTVWQQWVHLIMASNEFLILH